MNALGVMLLWLAAQATVFATMGVLLYLAARRRGSALGADAVTCCLALIVVLGGLAFCPWPRWLSMASLARSPDATPVSVGRQPASMEASPSTAADVHPVELPVAVQKFESNPELDLNANWLSALGRLGLSAGKDELDGADQRGWTWSAWIAVGFVCGVAVCSVRLALGMLAVWAYRRRSRPVGDVAALKLFHEVRAATDCTPIVQLCECERLASPAVVGWRRPIVILPADWRSWSQNELRAVLAHELVHVSRRDYLRSFIAECCLTIQFYHPLVHWLARRLRLDQELTADVRGAAVAGGTETYMRSLAALALRADDARLAWAARPFLPERGMLLRRIEMLRTHRPGREAAFGPMSKTIAAAMLFALAIIIAGLRQSSPAARQAVAADPPAAAPMDQPIDLTYIPKDAIFVAAIRPGALAANPRFAKLAAELKVKDDLVAGFPGLSLSDINVIKVAATALPTEWLSESQAPARIVWSTTRDVDWKEFTRKWLPNASIKVQHRGVTFYRDAKEQNPAARLAAYSPDPRTFVISSELDLKRLIEEGPAPVAYVWDEPWSEVASEAIAIAIDAVRVRAEFAKHVANAPANSAAGAFLRQALEMFDGLEYTAASLHLSDEARLQVKSVCASPTAAEQVKGRISALLPLAKQGLAAASERQGISNEEKALFASTQAALDTVNLNADGASLEIFASWPAGIEDLDSMAADATRQSREAARRSQSANSLRQIGQALQAYEDEHKSLPPAVLKGPNGTPYSWRVAILPYLEQQELYGEYRKDEPWDSESNRRVLAKMPAVYRDPKSDSKSTVTAFLAVAGESTCFHPTTGVNVADVLDGLSKTILVVEKKSDVPWTKPEDFDFDPAKELPGFGGFYDGGFNVLMGDGAVRFVSASIQAGALRNLFTKAGGGEP